MGQSRQVTQTTQSQERNPYAAAQPGLNAAGAGINAWMNDPRSAQAYGGPRVAQMSERTRGGLDAMAASGGAKQSESYLQNVVGGQYLDQNNPHLKNLQDSIQASVMPSINSRVTSAGMAPGSSVDQALVGKEMTRAMAQPLFQQYENERGRQMQAAGMLPGVSQGIIGNQIGAGQMGEGYEQRNIDAGRQEFEERRTAGLRPFAEATPLLGQIGQQGGTSTTTGTQTQTQQTPRGQQILGGAMMGAGLLGQMYGLPTGGMMGGGGLFGGLFGGGRGMVNGWENNDPGGRAYDAYDGNDPAWGGMTAGYGGPSFGGGMTYGNPYG